MNESTVTDNDSNNDPRQENRQEFKEDSILIFHESDTTTPIISPSLLTNVSNPSTTFTLPTFPASPSASTSVSAPTITPSSSSTPSQNIQNLTQSSYKLKEIYFSNRYVKILCQNTNGPCPLLSICNALLLSNSLHIHPDYSEITLHSLIELLANYILETSSKETGNDQSSETTLYHQQRLSDVISLLPSLQYGLDINIHFDHVNHFEYTRELDCFDASHVTLYHGWVLDSQDIEAFPVIGSLSYNQIINLCVEYQSLRESLNRNQASFPQHENLTNIQKKLLYEGQIAQNFLNETASQFTYMGLLSLYDTVSEGSLCAFFRNNHFSTLHKRNNKLYLLVTDLGYAHESEVVWELLDEINGNTEYVNSFFQSPVVHPTTSPSQTNPSVMQSFSRFIANNNPTPNDPDEDLRIALEVSRIEYGGTSPTNQQDSYHQQQYQHHHHQPLSNQPPSSAGMVGYARPSNSLPQTQDTFISPLHQQPSLAPTSPHPAPSHHPTVSSIGGGYGYPYEQEEYDRLHALALQEEYRRLAEEEMANQHQYIPNNSSNGSSNGNGNGNNSSGSSGGGGVNNTQFHDSHQVDFQNTEFILGQKIHPEELERYKAAERQYFSTLQQQSHSQTQSQGQGQGQGQGQRRDRESGEESQKGFCLIQ